MPKTPPLIAIVLLALLTSPAGAQLREWTVEASPIRGAVGYAWEVSPRALLGLELGVGVPQIDRTLEPEQDPRTGEPELEEYLHVAILVRWKPSEHVDLDAGLRGSVANLWPCTASDCWPAGFGGAYLQPMVGWPRFKVGLRLIAGWIRETPEGRPAGSTFTAGLTPFILRATF